MTPEIINAQNQVKELEVLAAQDSKRYGVDLNIWKQKLAQYQEHAVANSPEASALLKSNPTAYLQKYGSAQDIKNQASGVNPPAVAPSVLDPTTLRGNEQGLAPTATPLGGATGFPTIPPQIPNLMANKDGIAPLQTGGASGYSSLPSSFSERMNLAGQAGITNYTGTPQQNAQIQAFQAKQQTTPPSAQTTPTGQNLAIKGTLQQGSSDVQVGNLQKTLNEVAQAGLVVDNNFGPKTKQAVMAFQQANGLVADGIVGPKTLAKIQELQGQKTQQQNTVNTAVNTSLTQSGVSPEALEQKFATNPTGTIQEIVNQVSQTAGLSQLNTQIQNLTQQQKELADKKVQELNEITNNPWISESLKARKIGNLDSKYQGLEQNISSALQIATNQLGNAEEQVRYITSQAINQYNTQQKLDETRSQNAIENALATARFGLDVSKFKQSLIPSGGAGGGADGITTLPDGTVINTKLLSAQDKITSINDLLEHKGLNVSVGPSILGRLTPLKADVLTGDKADFIAGVQQLVSKDTLDTLINLKQAGGTLGALSDQERIMLQSAATKIGTWAIRDDGGNVKGYSASESSFKKELDTIKHLTERAYLKAGGNAEDIELTITNDGHILSENYDGTLTQII